MPSSSVFSLFNSSQFKAPSFGIAFDIDGVILRGGHPIGGSPQALRKLYHESGTLKVPFVFLTNGGGVPESKRALELSELLGVNILPSQVLCDILRSGQDGVGQPALYFAADDLEYQAAFPAKRLGVGAFRIALESIFNRVHHTPLEYTIYGKPKPVVFKNAETILRQLYNYMDLDVRFKNDQSDYFKALYMIGDNPAVDIKGAKQAGHPWIPVLTRTGMFQEKVNHREFPADLVVDTVEDAVDYILEKELSSGFMSG